MTILLPIAKPVAAAVAASVRGLPIGWGVASAPPDGENQAPAAGTLDLGALTVGTGAVFASSDLLAGATDADGDTLTITSVTAVSGGTVSGTGPWTITPATAGPGSATVVISDGTVSVNRTVAWDGVEVVAGLGYSRLLDYQGVYRQRIGSVGSYITVPTYTYSASADTVVIETAALCYSGEPYVAGTVENSTLFRGSALAQRDNLIRTPAGEVRVSSSTNGTSQLLAAAGTWPLNEVVRFRLTFSPSTITLEKMDSAGVYQPAGSIARGGFSTFVPYMLLGANRGFHGTIFYLSATLNGVTQYDFRFDEMSFIGTTMRSAHDSNVTASVVGAALAWRDETPESLAPQPDLVISGSLTHGSTVTITSPTLTFTGGMPQAQLYDDMVGRSGNVGTAATIGAFTTLAVDSGSPTPTYKTGGPGGRPYVLRRDGATGERFVRHWVPGFDFKEVFVSRLLRVPTGYAWPGATNGAGAWPVVNVIPSDSTWKDEWVLYADDAGGSGSDLVLGSHSGGYDWTHSGNTPHQLDGVAVPQKFDLRQVHSLGEWNHVDGFARHNDAVPTQGRHVMNYCSSKAKNAQIVALGSVLAEVRGFNQFRMILDGAYVQTNPLCRAEAAEIYMAAGPNAACRVVLGNSVRWEYCTKKGTCPPASWASGGVTARVGLGQLDPATDPVYLYVVGPDGTPLWPYGKRWLT